MDNRRPVNDIAAARPHSGRDRISGVLYVLGIIMMYWSTSSFMLLGTYARLGSLGIGFGAMILATILRIRNVLQVYGLFILVSTLYFSLLVMQTIVMDQQVLQDWKSIIFVGVAFSLFVMGHIAGRERHYEYVASEWKVFIVAAVLAAIFQLFFLKFMESMAFYGTVRKYGDSELNPIGVAYASGCLAMMFFCIGLNDRVWWRKLCYMLVFCTVLLILLASGSRGATIWISVTILVFLAMKFRRNKRRMKLFRTALLYALLVFIIMFILMKTNYAVSERIDILVARFSNMIEHFEMGKSGIDSSVSVRAYMWQKYLSTPETWFFVGERYYVPYPHNQWLEMLVRFGLLGIPLLVLSLLVFFRLLYELTTGRWDHDDEFIIIAGVFLFSYLQSMTSLDLEMNRSLLFGLGYFSGVFFGRGNKINQPFLVG